MQSVRAFGKSNGDIFDSIYSSGGWGSSAEDEDGLRSGSGSDRCNSDGYVALVADFITDREIKSVVDIGCGDFRVSRRMLTSVGRAIDYVGVDVSKLVVDRNNRLYSSDSVTFIQGDACEDNPPDGELVLVREVMQHLSNSDISKMIAKLRTYDHAIVTNTNSLTASGRNIDVASGASSRAVLGEGLWLDRGPFKLDVEELGVWPHHHRETELVAVLLRTS